VIVLEAMLWLFIAVVALVAAALLLAPVVFFIKVFTQWRADTRRYNGK